MGYDHEIEGTSFRRTLNAANQKSVKLDFDPAREESATDMMTAETET